jgi:hypothetical protein
MKTPNAIEARAGQRQPKNRRARLTEPVSRPSNRWTANDCIRLSVAIPTVCTLVLFVTAVLWCVCTGRIDPASLGAFTETTARAGFTGTGLLGVGALIVTVILAVLWSGRGSKPNGRIG